MFLSGACPPALSADNMSPWTRPPLPKSAADSGGSTARAIDYFFREALFFGIFAPALRASDSPIAMACLRLLTVLPGRVEDWRADCRLRWVFHSFRSGPQSGCHDHVSSPRHIERSVRFSRTTLTCSLRATVYGTYSTETTFRRSR